MLSFQVGFLKIPKVRAYFKIDPLQTFSPEVLPKKKKFVEGVKECKFLEYFLPKIFNLIYISLAWTNMKITNELQQRQRLDEIRFARAGKGALVKTYKYDPTKPRPAMEAAAAKKS